ncbi:SLC13 family permease [Zobellella aerophila]|uniref:SLC13 family permease n=1 Tax=Zobellella aerophila TaxID=870480 RepID=A0ABP6VMY1_9GAMM
MIDQWIIGIILLAALLLFILDYWRYDLVAMMALLIGAISGVVPEDKIFSGFGNAAVITVAAVLVISHTLWSAGVVDALANLLGRVGNNALLQLVALSSVTTLCSAFMNNVGAMAIMIPIALKLCRSSGNPVSKLLMPMAFGSLLGGCITLIGTPPNIIIADFRRNLGGEPFQLFDFTPVGLGVALAGLIFIWLLGHLLVPSRTGSDKGDNLYDIAEYLTEVYVPEQAGGINKTFYELEQLVGGKIQILALVRDEQRLPAPAPYQRLRAEDILVLKADAETLKTFLDASGLELNADEQLAERFLTSKDITVMEGVIGHDSRLIGRSAADLKLRRGYGVNLLAVAREGYKLPPNLANIRFKPGDVLLLQGDKDTLAGIFERFGCYPLAERPLRIGKHTRVIRPLALFGLAILASALGLVSPPVAFTACAGAMVLTGLIRLRELYSSIDWPIIVLLGATLPLGGALESTGAAASLAQLILTSGAALAPFWLLGIILFATMLLSNVINNAAAAVLMAPIAISTAQGLGAATDPFLMAVAIGASLPFLTPIGHQSNLLVMGPGGYAFKDYWKLGLPLSVLVGCTAVILILLVWPL